MALAIRLIMCKSYRPLAGGAGSSFRVRHEFIGTKSYPKTDVLRIGVKGLGSVACIGKRCGVQDLRLDKKPISWPVDQRGPLCG
jgi:hypothetical protein